MFPGAGLTQAAPALESTSQPVEIDAQIVEPEAEEVNGNVLTQEEASPAVDVAVAAPARARRVRKPAATGARKRAPRRPTATKK